MSDTDRNLDRLQELLDAIPADREGMGVAELDGYVAALIVCPDTILPSEWLSGVWGEDHVFEDAVGAEATIAAVMGHHNRIARELAERPEDYAPVLGMVTNSGETLSPALDINPSPSRHRVLETGIIQGGSFDASLDLALEACEFFDVKSEVAKQHAVEMARIVAGNWKQGLHEEEEASSDDDIRGYAEAFEHAEAEKALSLDG